MSAPAGTPPTPVAAAEARADVQQGLIRVRVREFTQLFNSFDPSPFLERDLDDDLVDYITSWAREIPRERPLKLVVQLHVPPREAGDHELLRSALQNHFETASDLAGNALRQLLRRGRLSLLIGLGVLALATLTGELLGRLGDRPLVNVLREGVIIGGWVAMWRPIEILLYDWWPLRSEQQLCTRLRDAELEIVVQA